MSKLGRYSADRKKVEDLSADKTVGVHDCGTLFTLSTATGLTASLPTPTNAGAGWWCKFIVNTDVTDGSYAYMIKSDASDIHGTNLATSGSHTDGSSINSDGTAGTAVDIIEIKAACKVGDQVELVTDGTTWFATATTYAYNAVDFN